MHTQASAITAAPGSRLRQRLAAAWTAVLTVLSLAGLFVFLGLVILVALAASAFWLVQSVMDAGLSR